MYHLVAQNGPHQGKRLTIRSAAVTVGRGPDCALRLVGEGLLDRHARLEERDGAVELRALAPEAGLSVNGQAVTDRRLLAFVGAAFLGFVLLAGNKHDIYAILFYPFFLLMVADALVHLVRAGTGFAPQRAFGIGLLALLLVNSAQHYARPIADHRGYDYYSVTRQIQIVIPKGARVMGPPEWWLGLADYDYRSSLNLTYYHFHNGLTLTQGLETDRPDVL